MAEMLRVDVAKKWSAEHPDDAAAIIEALADACSRASGYMLSAEALPASFRDRKIEWLGKARFHLRGATGDPAMRTAMTAYIARLLAESGEKDQARKLMAEIVPGVEKLPLDGVAAYVRGVAAEALAAIDLPAALALIKDLKDNREYDRHHGNIARIMADARPEEALRALKLMRDDFQRDWRAAPVAYSLATSDLNRAADAIELISRPQIKAFAQCLVAQALGKENKPEAMARLDRAYDALARLNQDENAVAYNGYHVAPVWAAWLLPAVEAIDPERLDEFLWRAISLRPPLAKQGDRERTALASRAYLAMFLSRCDRELARQLYGDLAAESAARLGPVDFSGASAGLFAAAAMIDPSWSVDLYEKLPGDGPRNAKSRARGALVDILSQHGEARWRAASAHLRLPMPWHPIE